MKTNKNIALQLQKKQDFYSFKVRTVDKVHAVRPVDNNDMPFSSQKFNALNVWVAAKTPLNRLSLHL